MASRIPWEGTDSWTWGYGPVQRKRKGVGSSLVACDFSSLAADFSMENGWVFLTQM